MNLNSGVGDNAAGRYFGGMGGRGSGMSSRQMRQYMQMRRDEMSHGAFLSNQNAALEHGRNQSAEVDKFNRESSRIDANVQQQDWTAERSIDQGTRYGKANPHATSADLIGKKFGWNPAFAPESKPTDTGTPPPPPPTGDTGTAPVKRGRATKSEVETAVKKGFITAEEANEPGVDGKPMNPAYTRAYARAASSSPDKTARGRQFQGPVKGGTPAGSPAPNYDAAPKPVY